jgi:transposase
MAAAVTIKRTDHKASELRGLAAKSKDGAEVRRLLALALVLDGRSRTEAAEQAGMDRQTLRDWVHRYNDDGLKGLKTRTAPGRVPVLTEQQMAEFKELVAKGPDPEIHGVVRWRCCDLQEEVARRFQVVVHQSTIGKWLHKLEFTQLQPRPFHPNKDAEAQEAYKKTLLAWSGTSFPPRQPVRP